MATLYANTPDGYERMGTVRVAGFDPGQNLNPVPKTDEMTQPVGVDAQGGLWAKPGGVSDYADIENKPKINGVELSGDKTSADLGIGNPTDEQVASAVESWLDEHPEATTTVADGSISTGKLADNAVTIHKLSKSITEKNYLDAYLCVTYKSGAINDDGTIADGGSYHVTDYLPVIPGETIWLNDLVSKTVAFYNEEKTFVSAINVSSGLNPYVVPSSARYAIYQNQYVGNVSYFNVRKKETPQNLCFSDLIFSPLKTNVSVGVTGDSNTVGYGLTSPAKSWADLLMEQLEQTTEIRVTYRSRFAEILGPIAYGADFNYRPGSQFSFWTDATRAQLNYSQNYSSKFAWYKNDVKIEGSDELLEIDLDGELAKITVKFTGGQMVGAYFVIPKTVVHTNVALNGCGASNMPIPDGHDWLLFMIGTNDRSALSKDCVSKAIYSYTGKGTFVVPFPNHKTDATYVVTQPHRFNEYRNIFANGGFEIIDCSDVNAYAFYDNTLYQNDKIHFNADGHRVACNMISGKMGLPVMLQKETE